MERVIIPLINDIFTSGWICFNSISVPLQHICHFDLWFGIDELCFLSFHPKFHEWHLRISNKPFNLLFLFKFILDLLINIFCLKWFIDLEVFLNFIILYFFGVRFSFYSYDFYSFSCRCIFFLFVLWFHPPSICFLYDLILVLSFFWIFYFPKYFCNVFIIWH